MSYTRVFLRLRLILEQTRVETLIEKLLYRSRKMHCVVAGDVTFHAIVLEAFGPPPGHNELSLCFVHDSSSGIVARETYRNM